MFRVVDFRLLFVSDDELARSQEMLSVFKKTGANPEGVTDEEMWQAKEAVNAIIHPVTGEKMFVLGRMSAFIPLTIPIAAGMIIHGPTSVTAAMFWQWINQSVNTACNYVNRSGADVDLQSLLTSYGLAVATSCGLAYGAGRAMLAYPGLKRLGPFVPYFAVVLASTCNMVLTRMKEWQEGVPIFDSEGRELGISADAGFQGVMQTVLTRGCLVPVPLLLVPPIIITGIRTMGLVPASAVGAVVLEIATITGCLQAALPLALAILPQTMELSVDQLEEEFQNLKDSKGNRITHVYANKGL